MYYIVQAILRGLIVLFATFLVARLSFADAECDRRLDACRTGCFDHYARDQPALARCRDRCNRTWLSCGGK